MSHHHLAGCNMTDIDSATVFLTSGEDIVEAEKECKQLVIEAGRTIKDDGEYLDGFI